MPKSVPPSLPKGPGENVLVVGGDRRIVDENCGNGHRQIFLRSGARLEFILTLSPGPDEKNVHRALELVLDEPDCTVELFCLLRGSDSISLDLTLRHLAPRTHSRVVLRSVADGNARLRIFAEIHVAPGAWGCSADLQNRNLLLSPEARVETMPVLDVHCKDAQCRHGASVGGPDPGQMFYLRSRGLTEAAAKDLLGEAFSVLHAGRAAGTPRLALRG